MSVAMQQHPQAPYAAPVHRKPIPKPGMAARPANAYDHQYSHSRTRTTSSGIFPGQPSGSPTTMHSMQYAPQYPQYPPPQARATTTGTRRTLSNATSSTSSTTGTPSRTNSGNLRRSSSTRSGNNSPSSYVALLRKQKATVYSDRAQYEDPRILAQQRAAKMRANTEVAGGPHHAGTARAVSASSSVAAGVRSKITHRAPKASLYAPANLSGSGVPMRLSASEVDEGDVEDNASTAGAPYHQRTGSGRSSLGSGRRIGYASGRLSTASTPPNGSNHSPTTDTMAGVMEEETPVASYQPTDYFEHTTTGLSGGSGSSGERNFGDVGQMPQGLPKKEAENTSDLHRRGSVDERTTTMSNTRLFIANPDLSD